MINIVLLYPDKSAKYPLGFHLQLFYFIFWSKLQLRFHNQLHSSPKITHHSTLSPIKNQGLQIDLWQLKSIFFQPSIKLNKLNLNWCSYLNDGKFFGPQYFGVYLECILVHLLFKLESFLLLLVKSNEDQQHHLIESWHFIKLQQISDLTMWCASARGKKRASLLSKKSATFALRLWVCHALVVFSGA